jgi:hypothetical protein
MKMTVIALLLIQLIVLTACSDAKRLWDIFISTRESPVTIDRIWDIEKPERRLLLVMVHGFNSSKDEAWGKFPDIIKSEKDTAFERFNVLRYGYGSAACRNEVDIADRGDGLNSFLSDQLDKYDGMIIMGHSLGGLVAMHALVNLAKAHHPDLARIPVTVMTFGTPYSGVQGAELLGQMAIVCTDKQAEAVTLFSRSLRDLKVDWDSYFGDKESKYHVTMKPFYGPADRLVSKDNACGPFRGCEQVVDGENHVMIVKPSDTNHSAYTKLRVQVDSMTDRIYGPTSSKRTAIQVPSTPTIEPRKPDDMATLLKTCGASSSKRPEEEFVGRWVSQANVLYKKRKEEDRDLENLMELQGRAQVADIGIDIYSEIVFTFRCLEKMGYLKLEKFDPPRMYGGGKENLKIIFSESRMPIPVPSTPTIEPRKLDDVAALLKTCGASSSKRPEEEFVGRWVSQADVLYKKRKKEYRDLENLMELQGRAQVADIGIDIYSEIVFTFRCLEKMGYLKLEKFDPPRMYGGGKENLKIIFLESRMPIPY